MNVGNELLMEEHVGPVELEDPPAVVPGLLLSARAGGPASLIGDGESGILGAPEPAALADALLRVIGSPRLAARLLG